MSSLFEQEPLDQFVPSDPADEPGFDKQIYSEIYGQSGEVLATSEESHNQRGQESHFAFDGF